MPWKVANVMDQRIAFVIEATQPEVNLSKVCRKFDISRRTGYKWLMRYAEAGSVTGLKERSRRPRHSPGQTPEAIEDEIVALRKAHSWGGRKLQVLLARKGVVAPEVTINRILKRRGLVNPEAHPSPAPGRFQREECNQLWQMDFKGEYPVIEGKVYPLVVLDDHSRYLMGLWPLAHPDAVSTKAALETLFREQGMPEAMLMDHGTPWWGNSNFYGLTGLSVWIMRQGTRLLFSRIGHPQTQGKTERQNRSLKERTAHEGLPADRSAWHEWADRYREEYNHLRPHEALEMRTPGEVWQPVNLRPYQEQPPAWDYGEGNVGRIDALGMLSWAGRRYFVCEALVGEWVRVDAVADSLVVTFCNTTLREINLRTGQSRPVSVTRRFS
jgi:transposase InsO family protein